MIHRLPTEKFGEETAGWKAFSYKLYESFSRGKLRKPHTEKGPSSLAQKLDCPFLYLVDPRLRFYHSILEWKRQGSMILTLTVINGHKQ